MSSRIAAIVTTWNRPNVVLDALDSVAGQMRSPDRLVIVDDCSTDETPASVRAWIARNSFGSDVCFVQPEINSGPGAARNLGADHAESCDVIAFLDDDDLWPKDYLSRVEQVFLRDHDAVVAVADRGDIDLQTNEKKSRLFDALVANPPTWLIKHGLPGTPNTAYRKLAFNRAGRFDPNDRFAEDYPLLLRLSIAGPWAHVPGEPVIVRRNTTDSIERTPRLSKKHANRRKRVAEMLEHFLLKEGGAAHVPSRIWRRRLSRMWYAAGRQMLDLDQPDEAVRCFQRARQIDRKNLRAWWRGARVRSPA